MRVFGRKIALLAGAAIGGMAATPAFAQNSGTNDVRQIGADTITQIVSESVQAQRVYDSITGRVYERLVLGEAGNVNPTGVASGEHGLSAGGRARSYQWGTWGSLGYDQVEFAADGSDWDMKATGFWIGADVLIDERLMLGASVGYVRFSGDGLTDDRYQMNDDIFWNGSDVFNWYGTIGGDVDQSLEGWAFAPYGALILNDGFFIDAYASFSGLSSKKNTHLNIVEQLCTGGLTDCSLETTAGGNVAAVWDTNEDTTFENDFHGINTGIDINWIMTGVMGDGTLGLTAGYQYIYADQERGTYRSAGTQEFEIFDDGYIFGGGTGASLGSSTVNYTDAGTTAGRQEPFDIVRASARFNKPISEDVQIFARGTVRFLLNPVTVANSEFIGFDTASPTSSAPDGIIEGSELNQYYAEDEFDPVAGTVEFGAMFSPTDGFRLRVAALADISEDVDRFGVTASAQFRF